jgi:hypothetical protein
MEKTDTKKKEPEKSKEEPKAETQLVVTKNKINYKNLKVDV